MLDDRTAVDQDLNQVGHFIWTNQSNYAAWSAYLAPLAPGSGNLPPYTVAARRGELNGLPQAWLGVCSLDLFANENKNYAQRLRDAGVDCQIECVKDVPHAFEAICPEAEVSKRFVGSAIAFLKRTLD